MRSGRRPRVRGAECFWVNRRGPAQDPSSASGQGGRGSRDGVTSRKDGPLTDRKRGDSMTSRDRQPPGDAAGSAPSGSPSSGALSSLLAAGASPTMWEQWYRSASAAQRGQLLDQARQQGLLFTHQLPPGEGGVDPASCAARVAELLSGRPTLEPVTAAAFEPI